MCALCGDVVPAGAAAVLVAQMIHDQAMWGYWALPEQMLVHADRAHEVRTAFGAMVLLASLVGIWWSLTR